MASSFQRRTKVKLPSIAGVYPSIYSQQLLSSTGAPDLDALVGGGLPVGTVLLIQEDASGGYAKQLLKYFLAEGVVHRHGLHLATLNTDTRALLHSLPSYEVKGGSETAEKVDKASDDQMKIAWRYQNLPKDGSSSTGAVNSHTFNMLKTITSEVLDDCAITTTDKCDIVGNDGGDEWSKSYSKLLTRIHKVAEEGGFLIDPTSQVEHKNILRIGVQSLGSLLWGEGGRVRAKQMAVFLMSLRALLRSCFGIAVITVPDHVFKDPSMRSRLISCSDFLIGLEAFEGDVHSVYKDYHGILHLVKLPSLGSLASPSHLTRDTSELVFKSKRTKFAIEKFHLPPDLSETVSRDQKDAKIKSSKNIDF